MKWTVVAGGMATVLMLAGCAGPEPRRVYAEPIAACDPYRSDPTALARCRLFASGLGEDLIPDSGRSASLDAQVRCAHLRTSPGHYASCIEAVELEASAVAGALAAGEGPDLTAPITAMADDVEPAAPGAAVGSGETDGPVAAMGPADAQDAFARLLEEIERLDPGRRAVAPGPASNGIGTDPQRR